MNYCDLCVGLRPTVSFLFNIKLMKVHDLIEQNKIKEARSILCFDFKHKKTYNYIIPLYEYLNPVIIKTVLDTITDTNGFYEVISSYSLQLRVQCFMELYEISKAGIKLKKVTKYTIMKSHSVAESKDMFNYYDLPLIAKHKQRVMYCFSNKFQINHIVASPHVHRFKYQYERITNDKELVRASVALNNCFGTAIGGYVIKLKNKLTNLFAVKQHDKIIAGVEIKKSGEFTIKGKNNSSVSEDILNDAKEFWNEFLVANKIDYIERSEMAIALEEFDDTFNNIRNITENSNMGMRVNSELVNNLFRTPINYAPYIPVIESPSTQNIPSARVIKHRNPTVYDSEMAYNFDNLFRTEVLQDIMQLHGIDNNNIGLPQENE